MSSIRMPAPARYALDSAEAGKTGEWLGGIGRLHRARCSSAAAGRGARICSPTWRPCAGRMAGAASSVYPGSPAIALPLMRPQDMLIANELHPEDRAASRPPSAPIAGPR